MNLFTGNTEFQGKSTGELKTLLFSNLQAGPKARVIIALGSRVRHNKSVENIILSESKNEDNFRIKVMGVFNIATIAALVVIQYFSVESKQKLKAIIDNKWNESMQNLFHEYLDMEKIEF